MELRPDLAWSTRDSFQRDIIRLKATPAPEQVEKGVAAPTPGALRAVGLAIATALAAFWILTLQPLPETVAADAPPPGLRIPLDLPSAAWDAH